VNASAADPPGDVPLVFVEDLDDPRLSSSDRHHLERVLRVRAGDEITVSDGAGHWRAARLGNPIDPVGATQMVRAPGPRLTIAFALVKGTRPELVVQKLTELGIDRIVPFVAERSVVRWVADRDTKHLGRLRRVAREASMQSRRTILPEVADVSTFTDVVGLPGVAAADRAGEPPDLGHPVLAIGPEGGWSPDERAQFTRLVRLGDLVLRAETAAIAGGALLAGLRAGAVAGAG
jgi:16S rRNA (uracil1498-N3)-methyltransferase